jgi:catechol 2,3-dioxygenase-like lactoylglutathione lyase family enzyme
MNGLPVKASRIIHTIHGVREIDRSRLHYQDVLGAISFNEGYEPSADRDMALLYVADHMIEPMAPRNPDDMTKAMAKWVDRYGEGWHSFEIKVDDAPAAAAALEAAGARLIKSPYPVFFFVRAESTGGVLLEVCEKPMRNDPKDRRNWNDGWAEGLECGLLRLDHIACVVRDLDAAQSFFTQMIDGDVLEAGPVEAPQPARRALLRIGDTRVAFIAPDDPECGPLGDWLARPNSGIYALVWRVEDEARARSAFEALNLGTITTACVGGGFAINPANFFGARHEFKA